MVIYKTPILGSNLKRLLNLKGNEKSFNFTMKDLIKAIVSTIVVLLFSISKNKNSESLSLKHSIYGFSLVILALIFDSLKSIKVISINNELENKDNELDELKFEYYLSFNFGIVVISIIGIIYQLIFSDLWNFLILNCFNYKLYLLIIVTSISSSFSSYFNVSILREEGPITLSIISSFRKCISIILSMIIYNKTFDNLKIIGLILVFIIIVYETVMKYKSNMLKKIKLS